MCVAILTPLSPERKKGFLVELLDETMMLQCTSKADMEDWIRDMNRLRGGRVDLASGQNIGGYPAGHDIYEGRERVCVCVSVNEVSCERVVSCGVRVYVIECVCESVYVTGCVR